MNTIRNGILMRLQIFVDKVNGKPIDIVGIIGYIVTTIFSIVVIVNSVGLIGNPIIKNVYSANLYAVLIMMPMALFLITLMGKKLKLESVRLSQFIFVVVATSIFSLGYISQVANITFIDMVMSIKQIKMLPFFVIEGNSRLFTFFFPLIAVLPLAITLLKVLFDDKTRLSIIEYKIEALMPTTFKMDHTTVDITICEDIETGDKCIVPEKKTFEGTWLQGASGGGKTALYIRPILEQLFRLKAKLLETEKQLAYKCLKEGYAEITLPISNYQMNNDFKMDYIKPKKGFEKQYLDVFKNYIVGVRNKENLLISEDNYQGGSLEIKSPLMDDSYLINIEYKKFDSVIAGIEFKMTASDYLSEVKIDNNVTAKIDYIQKDEDDATIDIENNNIIKELEDKLVIRLPKNEGYYYKIKVTQKGSGEIIYKGLGATVVAPDGGLPKDTQDIAASYGIKVHRIDPKMEEIKKGYIARFNPLKGGRPEKVGDIISSILVSMDQSDTNKGNPYFTNASIRAVRQLVILIKVMYPRVFKREPILTDILDLLNNFNMVVPLVEEMKKDKDLKSRWSSTISYFEASFYPPPVGGDGKVIAGQTTGSQRKETERAIGGIINQLDNFLGREEIKYILCSTDESLDLSVVLEKGECIAIATRQNELGQILGKAFALFFILSMQNEVLSRYSEDENPEIPHHLIIDEFPFYLNDNTKVFFTFARKYKCATTIAIQDMDQLKEVSASFGATVFTNTNTKILLPGTNVEDRKYWSEYFGIKEEYEIQTGLSTSTVFSDTPTYTESRRGMLTEKKNITEQNINELSFGQAYYSHTNFKGIRKIGKGKLEFYKIKENIPQEKYDFEEFNPIPLEQYLEDLNSNKENVNVGKVKEMEVEKEFEFDINPEEMMLEMLINDNEEIKSNEVLVNVNEVEEEETLNLDSKENLKFKVGSTNIENIDIANLNLVTDTSPSISTKEMAEKTDSKSNTYPEEILVPKIEKYEDNKLSTYISKEEEVIDLDDNKSLKFTVGATNIESIDVVNLTLTEEKANVDKKVKENTEVSADMKKEEDKDMRLEYWGGK